MYLLDKHCLPEDVHHAGDKLIDVDFGINLFLKSFNTKHFQKFNLVWLKKGYLYIR